MNFSIRPYAPTDFERLDAIRAAAFAPVFASFRALVGPEVAGAALASAEEEQALLKRLCAGEGGAVVFVAESGGAPVGFVSVIVDAAQRLGELGLNAVAPQAAGRGVGSALYAHALAHMRTAGMRAAFVGVGGDESHGPARRAYEKAGFEVGIPSVHLYRML